jgi:protein O-GlcNAc transferase
MSRHHSTLRQVQSMLSQGAAEQARSILLRALGKDSGDPWLNNAAAVVHLMLGQHTQAHYYAERAVKAKPDEAEFLSTLGGALGGLEKHDEAIAALERAVAIDPSAGNPRLSLANALAARNRHAAAAEQCREALARNPEDREVTIALMEALLNTGRADEAVALGRRLIETTPANLALAAWLPYAMNYLSDVAPGEMLAAHRLFGEAVDALRIAPLHAPSNTRDPERTLNVGLVSPDLRTHSVAFFTEPLLRHIDRGRVRFFCYSSAPKEDATSDRLRSLSYAWRSVLRTPIDQVARTVRNDGIDILIDLAGNTQGERLALFAYRAAPVQMTYLGYPNTTGLSCIDWRIVDSRTDPAGGGSGADAQAWCVERLARLDPCFLCYTPAPGMPAPSPPPSIESGRVTFGSFNTLVKLNASTVELWSRTVNAVEGSRLLLKCRQLADERTRADTVARFASAGLDPSRIEVIPGTATLGEHLSLYGRIDVGLDPFPYAGTTTTCEAMWMGVPVVTLAGDLHASRVGVSLLKAVGLGECVTGSREEFAAVASRLASDGGRLATLRGDSSDSLRARMRGSPLCDGAGFASRFESLLRAAWREWCEGVR